MTTSTNDPTIILIPGYWLGAWAWDAVVDHLTVLGRRPVPLTLPGLDATDPDRSSRTLDDQAAAIAQVARSAAAQGPVIVVAHSGANAPVTLVLDRHPGLVSHVIWVDSGPAAPASAGGPGTPAGLEDLPLPPFDVLAGQASLAGLSERALERFRARAVAMPGPVLQQPVVLSDAARSQVPTTVVCCSISSDQVRDMLSAGHPMFAELAEVHPLDLVDLPTGHWPMWSRPEDLAAIIAGVAVPTR